ncbi:hypothetical protein [Sphingomonas solaris]|uniref:Uncharacterized protein n=1 Tax=Alterirhizorhabdus solaris TaxID=2529389 RepID=A0A558R9I0_9SPHN|nr:hypothetical protein [Sphingomonas solaris]TVV76039.1 hypothetical protein FOY91_05530 [Sphingomonas solaris]
MAYYEDLSGKLFDLANGVLAFHVAQSLFFVTALFRNDRLMASVVRGSHFVVGVTFALAVIYAAAVVGCFELESLALNQLRDAAAAKDVARYACIGRVLVIFAVSSIGALITTRIANKAA